MTSDPKICPCCGSSLVGEVNSFAEYVRRIDHSMNTMHQFVTEAKERELVAAWQVGDEEYENL